MPTQQVYLVVNNVLRSHGLGYGSRCLFDEPTSALDPEMAGEVLAVMQDLAKSGMTMQLLPTKWACLWGADRVIFMDGGVIVEEGNNHKRFDTTKEDRTKDSLSKVL